MDLEKFFDTVNHDKLTEILSRKIKDGRVISLIRKYLRAGVMIGEKLRQPYGLSAISNRRKVHFLLYSDAMNADRMIHFMEALIKDIPPKVFFIIDNLKVHHSNKVKEWVGAHKDRIALFFLPPYSPEYNPDECLNHDLKQSVGSQQQAVKLSDIEENTNRFMENLKADEEHVQSYVDHPKVKGHKD